jgi:hypothetical protein
MRIARGDQAKRDRDHARLRLAEIEKELVACRDEYAALLPLRDNAGMDAIALKMAGLRKQAEQFRRILIVGK